MNTRIVLIVTLVSILSFGLSSARAADVFVSGFEDLPLMTGLSQVVGSSVLFDTPQGRIVQASAIGTVSQASVMQFYAETLPQLGWSQMSDAEFHREGEALKLEFEKLNQTLEVRFLVEPTATE